jgi:hypothetical protein
METAVYVGSGTNVSPLFALKTIQKFVFVYPNPVPDRSVQPGRERDTFLMKMRAALLTCGFSFSRQRYDSNWIFVNRSTSVIVSLWVNCPFPFWDVPLKLLEEIGNATTLICCGVHPHASILQWMKFPRSFVTDTSTTWKTDENLVSPDMFSSWSLLVSQGPETVCVDFWSLPQFLKRHAREHHRRMHVKNAINPQRS